MSVHLHVISLKYCIIIRELVKCVYADVYMWMWHVVNM